jgi:hypothetical protein
MPAVKYKELVQDEKSEDSAVIRELCLPGACRLNGSRLLGFTAMPG